MVRDIYLRWVWANAWSEFVGLGGTMVFGFLVFAHLEHAGPAVTISGLVFAVIMGAALEGGVVGFAQATVLHRANARISTNRWIWATVVGAGTAWLLGMIPSTVIALADSSATISQAEGPRPLVAVALSAVAGVILGPVLSFPQALVLRSAGVRAWSWIPANAVAWMFGMIVIFGAAGVVPPSAKPVTIGVIVLTACLVTGAIVGATHGVWLIRLLDQT